MGDATGPDASERARIGSRPDGLDEATPPIDDAPDRFEIRGPLGSGGVGIVYRAFDRARNALVALKTLHSSGALDLFRFKREFRALADIAHPNLATLYELHTVGQGWFFTMELIEGIPFIRHVRPYEPDDLPALLADEPTRTAQGPAGASAPSRGARERILAARVDIDRLDDALYQLVDGVHALHRAGKLHRDLKPSNVLVEASGRVVLLDFGLVAEIAGPEDSHDTMAGTPSYMAPEAISDVMLTEAADWYSVGVMLYEALTGRRPFEGAARDVMAQKQFVAPPPVRELAPDAPDRFVQLSMALLARDPGQRPDAAAIYAALGRQPSSATLSLAATPPAFVGRRAELAELRRALDDSRRGSTAVILLGASGMGKSALMQHFLDQADAIVLEGRCYQRESVPYRALDTVIDALTTYLSRQSDGAVHDLLPRDIQALARLFPVLRRVPAIAMPSVSLAQPPEPIELRRRAFGALRVLLQRLAAARPVIVAIDDLQWGDADSAAFLAELIHHPTTTPILLLATHRSEEGDGSAILSAIRRGPRSQVGAIRDLTVGALPDEDALALLAEAGGQSDDDERARALVRDCGGSPFFLTELARATGDAEGPLPLDQVLQHHVARLPADARALLQLCAIAARPVGTALALRAAGIEREGASVATLRAERLVHVRRVDDAQLIEPYHDRIREAVVATLAAPARRQLHRSLAEALEIDAARDHEALVEHWREAGELARAGRHAATAAAAADDALAFHQAARLYAFALEFGGEDDDERRALRTRLGHALVNAGRLDEAADVFAAAAAAATGEEAVDLRRLEVEQRLRSGQLAEAMAGMQSLLAMVGFPLPATSRGLLLRLLGQSIRVRLRGDELSPRPRMALTPELDRRIQVLVSMAIGMAFVNPVIGRLLQLRLWRDALDSGQKPYLAIAVSMSFGYMGTAGVRARPEIEAARARGLALAAELGEAWIEGWVEGNSGLASYLVGRWREARERLVAGHRILLDRCSGVRWQLDIVEIYLTATLWCMGDTAELVRLVPMLVREAEERGDRLAERGLKSWRSNAAWLVLDRADEAEAHVDASVPPHQPGEAFQLKHYYELLSRGQIDLYRGSGARAFARCTESWHELERSMILRVQSAAIEAWFLRGRAALAAAESSAEPASLLRDAERAAKVIERANAPWALPLALALRATIAQRRGDADRARRLLGSAVEGFTAADMALFAAAARRRLGALVGGDEGASLIAEATSIMTDGKVADPASMTAMLLPAW